jgi:hypothetical protein
MKNVNADRTFPSTSGALPRASDDGRMTVSRRRFADPNDAMA